MTLAALKPEFEGPFAAIEAARPGADILPWAKSGELAARDVPAVRDTLGGHVVGAAIATYALFNLAYVLVHYAI